MPAASVRGIDTVSTKLIASRAPRDTSSSYFSGSTIVEGGIPSFDEEVFAHRDTHESHTDTSDIHRRINQWK